MGKLRVRGLLDIATPPSRLAASVTSLRYPSAVQPHLGIAPRYRLCARLDRKLPCKLPWKHEIAINLSFIAFAARTIFSIESPTLFLPCYDLLNTFPNAGYVPPRPEVISCRVSGNGREDAMLVAASMASPRRAAECRNVVS